jgi:hypothetical protein
MKNSMPSLLPSKIAPRGRGVDDLLTRGDQMRRAIFIVVTLVGIIGATASPAAAPWWQMKRVSGTPGVAVAIDNPGAAGAICPPPNIVPPRGCDALYTDRNQIFIDRFNVYTAPSPVAQTIRVDAYLYRWNGYRWEPTSYPVHSQQTNVPIPPNFGATFGSPYSDLNSCLLPYGCSPAFAGIISDQDYGFTIVVRITWTNFYPPHQILGQADYIPAPPGPGSYPWDGDIGCVPYTALPSIARCKTSYYYTTGLPTDQPYVGYLNLRRACFARPDLC